MSAASAAPVLRARFAHLADGLIPGTDAMPAPSAVDIGGAGLDAVLASRPDLADDLARALGGRWRRRRSDRLGGGARGRDRDGARRRS